MACLDTTALIDLVRGKGGRFDAADQVIQSLVADGQTLTTTRFSLAEMYVGLHRRPSRNGERSKLTRAMEGVPILEFDEEAAQFFGVIVADLSGRGVHIGDMDALIASVAISHGEAIVTRNTRHFRRIPTLNVIEY